ncbi:hypothetical protein CLOM_g23696 [Closterium sp. NIES-68]|nr:hypothetical protein CLOM_g23696 [Closterium sp. NIES-68]
MSRQMCGECKRNTELVHDHAAGDLICAECGLVVEAHSVDETSEWRTFSNEAANTDPVRVGGPTNQLLTDGGLTTMISAGKNGQGGGELPGRRGWASQGSNPDRDLINAFQAIGDMADRLGLVATIRDRANEIFKKVHDLKSIRGRSNDATYAACLYIACRQEDKPRTFKEIGAAGNNISKKEIGRATKFIVKQLEADMGAVDMGAVNAGDFMRRFCSHLGMEAAAVRAAMEVVRNTEQIDIRTSRAPISKAAAAIYMVTQLCSKPVPTKDISRATGVAEGTIRNTYKDLLPFASRLLPDTYAKAEDIAKLSPS